MNQMFSVVIPAKNAEKTIERAIVGIENQEYDNYEIIIVDDHSADCMSKIVRKKVETNSRIHYYESEGHGVSDARNTGLKHASGDIICFCDSDDYYEKGVFRSVDLLMKDNVSIVAGDYYTVSQNKKKQVKKSVPRLAFNWDMERFLNYCIANHCWELVTKFFRKDTVKEIKFQSKFDYAEDLDFFVRLVLNSGKKRCVFLNAPVYNYVVVSDSAMHDESRWYDNKCLKSDIYLRAISHYRKESVLTRLLIGKARFIISADKLIKNRRRDVENNLKHNLRSTWICMLLCFEFGIRENIKILLRLFLYIFFGVQRIGDVLFWRRRRC